jgi:two-component system response regulator FixJ
MPTNNDSSGCAGNVFLIEDDLKLRSSLCEILEFVGYRVYAYSEPQEFLDTFFELSPAMVLTDVRMPNMSGVELQKKLSLRDRKFPFVFISGESTISQAVEAVTQGAIEFLIKPFSRESLLAAVAKAISIDTERTRASERNFAFKERMSVLSPRERQVFGLLAQGYNNAELVDKLGVALSTVKEYKSELMYKLGLKTLSQLISLSAASVKETSNKK